MNQKPKHYFLIIAVVVACSYWFLDSIIHYFVFNEAEFELIPSDINELWMRLAILVLLVCSGVFADYHVGQMSKKEEEKIAVYKAMLGASNHILRNYLTKMQTFRVEAERCEGFNKEVLELYDAMINDTVRQLQNLDDIQTPSKENVEARYKPR